MPKSTGKTSSNRVPSYRRHKATGQAVVTLSGRDVYLGKFNPAASKQAYKRVIHEWSAGGGQSTNEGDDLTVVELLAAFTKQAKSYHSQSEQKNFQFAMKPLQELYGRTPIVEFGPLALKAVRELMVEAGLARSTINRRVNRLRQIFK